jgi:O-antigen/teichoic acid export membrane protein
MSDGVKQAFKHSSIYALGNIARQLAGFIMLPIYTRHLSPADYGVVGLLMALLALIEVFFGARLAQAIPKFYFDEIHPERQRSVISTALIVTGLTSLVTMVVLIVTRNTSSALIFNSDNYSNIIGLFSVLILTQALEYYAMTFIRIQQRPWLFIAASLTKLAFQLALNIWLVVYKDMGVMGVALASVGSSTLFALGLTVYTFSQIGMSFRQDQAVRMLIFNWPLWLAGLAGLYVGSANRYFINMFSSTTDVGLFELASKFSAILFLLVWDPFQQYWATERFKIYHSSRATRIFNSVFQIISGLLAIGALGIGLFAEPIIRIMASPAFHGASYAVPFLVLGAMFNCLTQFSNFSFLVKEKTFWITRNNYLTAILLTILFIPLIPQHGYVGAALAGLIAAAVQFLLIHRAGRRIYDMKIPLLPLALLVSIVGIILTADKLLFQQNILTSIVIKIGLLLAGTAALSTITLYQPEIRHQIMTLLPAQLRTKLCRIQRKHSKN